MPSNSLMDDQHVFNLVIAIAGFLGVFVFNNIMRRLLKLEDRVESLPREYVHKEDYRADMHDIKAMLKQISEKLDAKADKHGA